MSIEKEIYKNCLFFEDKLIKYGFKKQNKKLIYEKYLSDYDFKIIIEYNNSIEGKIIDLSTNEEYINFRLDNSGGFSSEVKQEFVNILVDIRDKCCEKQVFRSKQAQKINKYIEKKYNDLPEFLWANLPTYAVYRNKNSNKWYGIIGTVPINKVNTNSKSTEIVEILNLKTDKIQELLNINGIYRAYHMNKKSWISVILDDTLTVEQIGTLIDNSYNLVKNK